MTDGAMDRRGAPDRQAILFVSHDAWRTGAPMILLNFLRWLKAETTVPFAIMLREGVGELRPDFEQLAPVFAWNELPAHADPALPPERPSGLLKWFGPRGGRGRDGTPDRPASRDRFGEYLRDAGIGLIYSNTITNGEVLEAASGSGCPVLTHVHELDYWILHRMDPVNVEQNRRHTSRFVAVSHAVRRNLVDNVGIPPERVEVIHGFIPLTPRPGARSAAALRARLGIADDAFVVIGSGTTDWRKAPDLFVQLAGAVRRRRPSDDVHFVWVGGEHQGPTIAALRHDAVRCNAGDRVHFVGMQSNPLDYFAMADVFAMVSREDPFPLVALEAASVGTPVVTFDRSGGTCEFVESDAGIVVPYLDIEAMAGAVLQLKDVPAVKGRLGAQAASKIRRSHDIASAAPRLLGVIQRTLAPDPAAALIER